MQEAAGEPQVRPTPAQNAGPPCQGGLGYEVRAGLDDAEVEEQFDPQLALHLLREHKRRLSGPGGKRKNLRTTAQVATNAEVIAALTKRLKAFAVRASKKS